MSTQDTERALKIVERLMKAAPSGSVNRFATRMHNRLRDRLVAMPMSEVLDKVPGTIPEKARLLGVTRQTVHYWLNGTMRPGEKRARQLAKITGFSADAIRGHVSETA